MKSSTYFNNITPALAKALYLKKGSDFIDGIYDFMKTQNFEANILKFLFTSDDGKILLMTDNVENTFGIVIIENYLDGTSCIYCASEDEYVSDVKKAKDEGLTALLEHIKAQIK